MNTKIGFDSDKYLKEQTDSIIERVEKFGNKLYLEFGGKLVFDYHASRVLPGFDPNIKMRLLQKLKDKAEVILCIYAGDIERKKLRADFGITYDAAALKMIDDLREWGVDIRAVVITRFANQLAAKIFKNKLERRNVKVCTHYFTKGYPADIDLIVSDEGYGVNDYVKTKKPLVVVAGPGPGSGKLATCLSQLYHDHKNGIKSGYAKFETFPIWNIPLKHPVNIAYEAATADIKDFNMIDPFHLDAYNEKAINYNRDVEAFPLLRRILERITGAESVYKSPTDMGVNKAGFGIIDDPVVQDAARQEIIRRYFKYACEYMLGFTDKDTVERIELILDEIGARPEDRKVVGAARKAAEDCEKKKKGNEGFFCGSAIEVKDGTIITGKNFPLMHASSSLVLNAIKHLAGIPDKLHLLSPGIIKSVSNLKRNVLNMKAVSLDLGETLIALAMSATTNPTAQLAMEKLKEMQGCEVHLTHIPTPGDEAGLRRLGVHITSDPNFSTKSLYAG
ncbi:MAG: DUF1846 domain-containing protein [Candidatus Margulisiibacteriota bacterium]|nr:DUF1846 domain-containing protein [Candidatus Margulisiibacteriota bacterium]